jgi:hypothetical protein
VTHPNTRPNGTTLNYINDFRMIVKTQGAHNSGPTNEPPDRRERLRYRDRV